MYAQPVYMDAFNGLLDVSSDFVERYSDAPMDKAAAMPVMEPVRAMSFVF